MPCDTAIRAETDAVRKAALERIRASALRRIEAALNRRSAHITTAANGAVAFTGLTAAERGGLNDACIYRALDAGKSSVLRAAAARAEARGVRFDADTARNRAVEGWHSHDEGETFGKD